MSTDNNDGGRPTAPIPTNTPKGSVEREQVYSWRWENGFALWHPFDSDDVSTGVNHRGHNQPETNSERLRARSTIAEPVE